MKTRSTTLALLVLFSYLTQMSTGQELPRRVYLGIRMENLSDDVKRVMELDKVKGVLISEVLPNSTAQAADFKKGDILTRLDKSSFNSTSELLQALSGKTAGETFSYELLRDKRTIKGDAVFQAFPEEKYPDLKVIYSASSSSIGLQRIISTRPATTNKLPLIVFIGGIGCYSLDSPMDTARGEIQLLNTLSRAGYMCARLEKPGMGDNSKHCKACEEVSFMEETVGYVRAIQRLKERNDVDSSRVYIVGHSMGGVFAPLIARKTALAGIISYGTIGSNFIEYLAKTRRTIAEAYDMNPVETDQLIKDFCECSAYYFIDKLSSHDAGEKKEICKEYLPIFDLRSRGYNDELYALNIPELWSAFAKRALFVWGESDYVSSREDHQILNAAVNYYHPGSSEFITVKNSDHGMNQASTFREAQINAGSYNHQIGEEILKWLKKAS